MAEVSFGAAVAGEAEVSTQESPSRVIEKLEKLFDREFGDKRPKWAKQAAQYCREHPALLQDRRILISSLTAAKNIAADLHGRIEKIGL